MKPTAPNDDYKLLLKALATTRPSIDLQQVEHWVRQGRKRPRNHLFIWLSRVKFRPQN